MVCYYFNIKRQGVSKELTVGDFDGLEVGVAVVGLALGEDYGSTEICRNERFVSILHICSCINFNNEQTLTVGDVDGARVVSEGDLEGDLDGLEVGMAVVGLELGED